MIKFNLKQLLKEKGMTMTELSEKTNISRATLSTLATGKTQGIQFSTLEKIIDGMQLRPSEYRKLIEVERMPSDFDSSPKPIAFSKVRNGRFSSTFLVASEMVLYGKPSISMNSISFNFDPDSGDSIDLMVEAHPLRGDMSNFFNKNESLLEITQKIPLNFDTYSIKNNFPMYMENEFLNPIIELLAPQIEIDPELQQKKGCIYYMYGVSTQNVSEEIIREITPDNMLDRVLGYSKEAHKIGSNAAMKKYSVSGYTSIELIFSGTVSTESGSLTIVEPITMHEKSFTSQSRKNYFKKNFENLKFTKIP